MNCCIFLQVMQKKTPNNLSRGKIDAFINPPVIQKLGRTTSMNANERVMGEVTGVSNDIVIVNVHDFIFSSTIGSYQPHLTTLKHTDG